MGVEQAPTVKGKQAAKELRQAAAKDERKTEAETGRPLKKAADRFEERSKLRRQERRSQAEDLRLASGASERLQRLGIGDGDAGIERDGATRSGAQKNQRRQR